jgi:YbbR domain-containing protein
LNDDFVNDLDDGITADIDEDVEDDTSITVTLSLPEGLENASKLFFRVEEGS